MERRLQKILFGGPLSIITVTYLLVGILWILFSDQLVLALLDDPQAITTVQTYKGWGFIAVTTLFLYLLIQKNNELLKNVIRDLEKSKKEFESTFEQAPVGIVHHRPDEKWMRVNQTLCAMLDYDRSDILEMGFPAIIHPDDIEKGRQLDRELLTGSRSRYELEKRYRRKNGTYIPVLVTKSAAYERNRSVEYLVAIIEDITDRKQAEKASERSRKLMEELADRAWAAVWIRDAEGRFIFVNDEFRKLFSLGNENVIGKTVFELFDTEIAQQFYNNDQKALQAGEPVVFEEWVATPKGDRYYRTNIFPIRDIPDMPNITGGIAIDLTEQKLNEHAITESLNEKDTLLAEIHHRVKNNLALVSSFMELQAMKSDDPQLNSLLLDGVLRIKSIANIHEQLYQSSSLSRLYFSDGIRMLAESVTDTLRTDKKIDLELELEQVELSVNQGIPCSLLINEVLTNCLKHAFEGRDSGKVVIRLTQQNETIRLEVSDNGVGLPDRFKEMSDESLGLQLINVLTKQLRGEKTYSSSDRGTIFTLSFLKSDRKGASSAFLK